MNEEMPLVKELLTKRNVFHEDPCKVCEKIPKPANCVDCLTEDILAILRAERLKEAEWLEKWFENEVKLGSITFSGYANMKDHNASLKGDKEGDSKGGTPASP